jgi:hypothetical protein
MTTLMAPIRVANVLETNHVSCPRCATRCRRGVVKRLRPSTILRRFSAAEVETQANHDPAKIYRKFSFAGYVGYDLPS